MLECATSAGVTTLIPKGVFAVEFQSGGEGTRTWCTGSGSECRIAELTASLLCISPGGANRSPDLGWGQRHVEVGDPERRQGVEHGMHDRRRAPMVPLSPIPFHAQRVGG